MKEKWIGDIHFVFYRNFDIHFLPTISYIPKCGSHCRQFIFGFLRFRMDVFRDSSRLAVRDRNFDMIDNVRLALTDVPESRFTSMKTSLKEIYDWFDSFKLRLY